MDYYQILGVSREASETEIRNAYRKLVKKYHPDKNSSEEARQLIILINQAYDVLSDSEKKKAYDQPVFVFEAPVVKEDPREAHRREFLRRKREEARHERETTIRFKKGIADFIVKINYVIAFVGAIIAIDHYLPTITYEEKFLDGVGLKYGKRGITENTEKINDFSIVQKESAFIIKTDRFIMVLPDIVYLVKYPDSTDKTLLVEASPLLRVPKFVSMGSHQGVYSPFPVERTIHSNGEHFPLFILIPALVAIFFRYHGYIVCIAFLFEFFSLVALMGSMGERITDKSLFL